MAYIPPQLAIDQQRDDRKNAFLTQAMGSLVDMEKARKAALQLEKENAIRSESHAAQMDEVNYQKAQRALDPTKRDSFIQQSALEKLKQESDFNAYENRKKIDQKYGNPGENLSFEQKEQIKAKYKNTGDNAANAAAQKKITEQNVGLSNVRNAMESALVKLEDPNLPDDEKIKVGQGLYKLLNSAEGSDAVGAEEAKRIGSYLEYNIMNFTQPGAIFGRDLKGFTSQIKNYRDILGDRVKRNEQTSQGLKQGKTFTQMMEGQSKPKTVIQNGHTYTLNEQTGEYE